MFRKPSRRETECTHPDHRPMIPVFRTADELDEAIRNVRLRYDDHNPMKNALWR